MEKTTYLRIIIEGFQSIESRLVFDLNLTGLNLINGKNGSGKSTTFNAILWAEYGVNLKKNIATWEENRTENFKGTRVVVERTDGVHVYRIARHLNYKGKTTGLTGASKLMIFKKPIDKPKFDDKDLIGEGLHKSDMQELINNQLGMNSTTFMSSIFFGQRLQSMVSKPNADKRDIFDQLFDVDFVATAKDNAKAEQDKLIMDIDSINNTLEQDRTLLETAENTLDKHTQLLEEFASKKKDRVNKAKAALKTLQDRRSTLSTSTEDIQTKLDALDVTKLDELTQLLEDQESYKNTAKKSLDSANADVTNCASNITKAKSKITELTQSIDTVATDCPSCERKLTKAAVDKVKKNIKAKIKTEEEVIEQLSKSTSSYDELLTIAQSNYDTCVADISKTKESIAEFDDLVSNKAKWEATVSANNERLKELDEDIVKADEALESEKNAKKPNFNIKATEKSIKDYEESIDSNVTLIDSKTKRLDMVKWWVSKGFGSSGLKSFVFNAMLSQLNKFAANYASTLGFRVEFSIDMTKASKPFQTLIYKGDMVKHYEDLSGGQRQRVDIGIAFAMHDLVSINSNINLLVVDELFEGLDPSGIETAFELIREKAKTKAVYVITHSSIIDSMGSKSFTFDLDDRDNTYLV